mmetsp:Transcript_42823/g.103563  ORF Transcript_42823/g.103563 Transcript_42823/m.103563 type:complete len:129 (-) Transcript_42823:8-394(-)
MTGCLIKTLTVFAFLAATATAAEEPPRMGRRLKSSSSASSPKSTSNILSIGSGMSPFGQSKRHKSTTSVFARRHDFSSTEGQTVTHVNDTRTFQTKHQHLYRVLRLLWRREILIIIYDTCSNIPVGIG